MIQERQAERRSFAAEPAPDPDAVFLEWEREFARMLDESNSMPDGDESDRLFADGMDLDHRIRVTPARGLTGAAVKLRALLHPELGLIEAGTAESDEEALRTTLAAVEAALAEG